MTSSMVWNFDFVGHDDRHLVERENRDDRQIAEGRTRIVPLHAERDERVVERHDV